MVVGEYRRLWEHAATYHYVWGSYILVYGGLIACLAFRWRRLRWTEDRVLVLEERLRKLAEAEVEWIGANANVDTTSEMSFGQ